MLVNLRFPRRIAGRFSWAVVVIAAVLAISSFLFAQTSVSTGGIVGTVIDPSGAVVGGAKVTITNPATGQNIPLTSNSSGIYNSGSIIPGEYKVRVEAKGFRTTELPVTVEVGGIAPGNVRLQLGQETQVVEVQGSAVQVNTEQATVQGVVTQSQITNLPINGRNFLDLAGLEPGVQIQDGSGFDPTKNGFSSLSIGGRAGRTARIEVDGVDISDENVGTTTQNLSASSIQEFQIGQSSLDLSSSLTSSGTVNVTTKSGSNTLHGEGLYFFRDKRAGFAAFPGGQSFPFQRNQSGGSLGGPVIKDKVFFFANVEHSKQDFLNAVAFGTPFSALSGGYSAPFRDTTALGKLDWIIRSNMRAFYKFNYNNNSDIKPSPDFSPFLNRDNTPAHTAGVDFNTGTFTHSIRFGYSKFANHLGPPTGVGGILDPNPRLNIFNGQLQTGPNSLAPQVTIQSNKQIKYDGSKPYKNHVFRYGVAVNRIVAGGFAAFGALAPTVYGDPSDAATAALGPLPPLVAGDSPADNPLNYPLSANPVGAGITIYNGQGFFSEKPSFGFPAGGNFDTRFEFYIGDSWKAKPNLTISAGLHYVRDTGRGDSDLAPIPCSATTLITCTGNLLDQFGFIKGLGNRVNQPNKNFGPQLGVAWDPWSNGKTVIRAGIGLYFENNVFNNILFDRTIRLPKSLVFGSTTLCPGGGLLFPDGSTVTTADGLDIESQICTNDGILPGPALGATVTGLNGPVVVGNAIADLQQQFEAAVLAAGPSTNAFFVGNNLNTFASLIAPFYKSPRSVQMNIGFQREIRRGTVLQVDYIRNVGTHFLLGVDTNHLGDARFLDPNAAIAAINATLLGNPASAGCPQATSAGASSQAAVGCYLGAVVGANIVDFAGNGLDSANQLCSGFPCFLFGTAATFPGINPNVGQNEMFFPVGRSLYNGLQMSLRSNVDHPFPGVKHINVQVSYALSRFQNDVPVGSSTIQGDQDFLAAARDFNHPNKFFGPAGQDRTHQLSFGPILEFPWGIQFSAIGHLGSPLPLTMLLPRQGTGDIFINDVTGDGRGGDVVPGSNVGAFGRSVKAGGLGNFINNYNSNFAGQLTPAGQALVTSGLFTAQQLQALGAVTPTLQAPPPGNVGLGWIRSVDLKLAWNYKVKERFTIQPSISAFNAFNFANFDGPANLPSGILDGSAGFAINNLTGFAPCQGCSAKQGTRVGPGSGTFSLGAPRQLEFGLRVTF